MNFRSGFTVLVKLQIWWCLFYLSAEYNCAYLSTSCLRRIINNPVIDLEYCILGIGRKVLVPACGLQKLPAKWELFWRNEYTFCKLQNLVINTSNLQWLKLILKPRNCVSFIYTTKAAENNAVLCRVCSVVSGTWLFSSQNSWFTATPSAYNTGKFHFNP